MRFPLHGEAASVKSESYISIPKSFESYAFPDQWTLQHFKLPYRW